MAQSEALTKFYKEIQQWIDGGCKAHKAFYACGGLCLNLRQWWLCQQNGSFKHFARLRNELSQQFLESGLDTYSPFDKDDFYCFEENKYTNPARLQWIRDHSL